MKKPEVMDEFTRRRAERQRRLRKRRMFVMSVFFLFCLIILGVVLCFTVLFPIKSISASGSSIYTEEQITASCGLKNGDNLFTFSKSDVKTNLQKALPYLENIKISRKFPDSISIKVEDAKEYATFKVDEKYYAVSEKGMVLNSYDAPPETAFEVRSSGVHCEIGKKLEFKDSDTNELYEQLLSGFSSKEIVINYLDITDPLSISAKVQSRFIVSLGTSNDLEGKISHLSGMLKAIEPEKTGKINLSMWTSSDTEGTFVEGAIE